MNPEDIKAILEGLTPEISKSIKAEIEAMGLDKVVREHNVNAEADANKAMGDMTYQERTVGMVKALVAGDKVQVKLLAEGALATGGELVPPEYQTELINMITTSGFLRSLCHKVPVNREAGQYPAVSGGVTTYWKAENVPYTASDPGFTHIPYVIHKLTGLTSITDELNMDNVVSIYNWLVATFAQAIGNAEDAAILNGTGVGDLMPLGIFQTPGVGALAQNGAHLNFANLLACKYRLPEPVRERGNPIWLFNATNAAILEGMIDLENRPLFRSDITGDRPNTLLSYPWKESPFVPAGTIALVDFSYYYLFDREQVTFKASDQTLDAFTNDLTYLKCRERIDGRLMIPSAAATITSVTI